MMNILLLTFVKNNNQITSAQGLSRSVTSLFIACNKLYTLSDFVAMSKLQELNICGNFLSKCLVDELKYLSGIDTLRHLWISVPQESPVEQHEMQLVRQVAFFLVPQLETLDKEKIEAESKVHSANEYGKADVKAKAQIVHKYFADLANQKQ